MPYPAQAHRKVRGGVLLPSVFVLACTWRIRVPFNIRKAVFPLPFYVPLLSPFPQKDGKREINCMHRGRPAVPFRQEAQGKTGTVEKVENPHNLHVSCICRHKPEMHSPVLDGTGRKGNRNGTEGNPVKSGLPECFLYIYIPLVPLFIYFKGYIYS